MISDLDMKEIRRLKELRNCYLRNTVTIEELKEEKALADKWNPIDVVQMLLDEIYSLTLVNDKLKDALEKIGNYDDGSRAAINLSFEARQALADASIQATNENKPCLPSKQNGAE